MTKKVTRAVITLFLLVLLFIIPSCTSEEKEVFEEKIEEPKQHETKVEEVLKPKACSIPEIRAVPDQQSEHKSVLVHMLTGEVENRYDKNTRQCYSNPTLSRTESNYGMKGTDLGKVVEHKGKVYIPFGDTQKSKNNKVDYGVCPNSIAYISSIDSQGRIKLDFLTEPGNSNSFLRFWVEDEPLNCFDVPQDGISYGNNTYFWFHDDNGKKEYENKNYYTSFLAKTDDITRPLRKVYHLSYHDDCMIKKGGEQSPWTEIPGCIPKNGKFISVSADVIDTPEGKQVYLFGTQKFRSSYIYLLTFPLDRIEDKSSIKYFAGLENCEPKWSSNEGDAVPAINSVTRNEKSGESPCAGENDVFFDENLNAWVAMYQCGNRVVINTANNPWGPWSDAEEIYNPVKYGAYCDYIYGKDCSCLDMSGQGKPAGVYAPFALNSVKEGEKVRIDYGLSLWNPYEVAQLRTYLKANY